MCGFIGFYNPLGLNAEESRVTAQSMCDSLVHRGPDDEGVWIDSNAGIALGHRRLSILDLSSAGHQPMKSFSGRYVIAFNGEIYNHFSLREELNLSESVAWRGTSDTETLLAGFERWGIEATLKKTVGMFAFALWDNKNQVLTIARDRMGEKPLYYGWCGNTLLFGSELKAFKKFPNFKPEIDRRVLEPYLRLGYIPAPYSIYHGIQKLLPGTFIHFPLNVSSGTLPVPKSYWSLNEVARSGLEHPIEGSDKEVLDQLEASIVRSVSLQSVADVPLGAFLSGGIDSSLVVALMQSQSIQPVKTFTIGFHEKEYNEASHAEKIAKYLGTDHTTLYISQDEILESIPKINDLYDEPFSDASASMLVANLARQKVKVSLSGDGGDELFGGYDHYVLLDLIWRNVEKIPDWAKLSISRFIYLLPPSTISFIFDPLVRLRGRSASIPFGKRLRQIAKVLRTKQGKNFYYGMKSHGNIERDLIKNAEIYSMGDVIVKERPVFDDFQNSMMFEDAMSYLPDDILVKVDRSSMAASLETRAPLLDHRIVELSWKIPVEIKMRDGIGKWPLRQVLYRHVPKGLVDRPKMGFNLPGAEWLRGPLRDWTEELLSEDRLIQEGFFNAKYVREILKQHNEGKYNWQAILWRLLAFQSWVSKELIKS
jgi:asparagine synthase (glutamine-hydrolysing)